MHTRIGNNSLLAAVVLVVTAGGTSGAVRLAGAAETGTTAAAVVPVEPYRVLDTRNGVGAPAGAIGPGETIDVQIAGVGAVPADAVGVVVNITGTQTSDPTYITAWPTGSVQPTASVLNLTPGIDAPNGVTALLGDGGQLSLFNYTGTTHLVADVAGYLTADGLGSGGPAGPAGPIGPAGPAGPAGPPGAASVEETVRAWVSVTAGGSEFIVRHGIGAVTWNAAGGRYEVTFSGGEEYNQNRMPAVVTPTSPTCRTDTFTSVDSTFDGKLAVYFRDGANAPKQCAFHLAVFGLYP